jgi:uncharacterized protein YcbK (DUF882 family)
MNIIRRRILRFGGLLAAMPAALLLPRRSAAAAERAPRHIALLNLHTDERLEIVYFRDGAYVAEAFAALARVLRDFRSGDSHAIDPKLMDYLVEVADSAGVPPEFSVISGYRSPETNGRLPERSQGVAKNSLHMQGRAIDVRLRRIDSSDLAARALDLARGGVGYYRTEDFVHLDTGGCRSWRG